MKTPTTKKEQTVYEQRIEMAIRGLLERFEKVIRYRGSCSNVTTKETCAIEKKIKVRESELAQDSKLKSLREELAEARKSGLEESKKLHDAACDLLRQFQLHGVSETLVKGIEDLAKKKPVIVDCDC